MERAMTSDVRVVRCGYADWRVAVGCCYTVEVYGTEAEALAAANRLISEPWLERARASRALYAGMARDGYPEGFTSDDLAAD